MRPRHPGRVTLAAVVAMVLFVSPVSAAIPSGVATFTWSKNMHPLGEALSPVPLTNATPGSGIFNSDLAFWGKLAIQGTYNGFNLIDITEPDNPVKILDYNECSADINGVPTTAGNQGDIVVWGDILIRAWNSNTTNPAATCDGDAVPLGFEGLHVFDISNRLDPDLIASVDLAQGSHTLTLVPDEANGRLLVYNNASSGANPGIDIVEVPLANPAGATFLRVEPAGRSCHDSAVILGDAMLASCAGTGAGGPGLTVWSLSAADGGSLTDPVELYQVNVTNTTTGHTAAFSWDGEVAIFGTEPGGGGQARCQETGVGGQTDEQKSIFFYDARTGALLGTHVLPRPQTALENCTIHNLNAVPLESKKGQPRRVLVHGSYQSGIGVVDFSDPANAVEIAFADPAPLVNPDSPASLELGGDWSTYWYNGRIYESDITRGMFVWDLSDNAVAGAMNLGHLNPQTQEFTID